MREEKTWHKRAGDLERSPQGGFGTLKQLGRTLHLSLCRDPMRLLALNRPAGTAKAEPRSSRVSRQGEGRRGRRRPRAPGLPAFLRKQKERKGHFPCQMWRWGTSWQLLSSTFSQPAWGTESGGPQGAGLPHCLAGTCRVLWEGPGRIQVRRGSQVSGSPQSQGRGPCGWSSFYHRTSHTQTAHRPPTLYPSLQPLALSPTTPEQLCMCAHINAPGPRENSHSPCHTGKRAKQRLGLLLQASSHQGEQ